MSTQVQVILNHFLESAAEKKASNLYLFPGQVPFIRQEGIIMSLSSEAIIDINFIDDLAKTILSSVEQEKLIKNGELTISKDIGKQRVRLDFIRQKGLLSLSIKLIPSIIVPLDRLKVPKVIKELASLDKGLIIISGPRDSGRSTLLAAMIDYINKNFSKYIATLEEPIEQVFLGGKSLVEQREIGQDVPNFSTGLHSIKNRNVDVVVVSNIDNSEQMQTVLEIAQKGVLVFITLDFDSSSKIIQTILKWFPHEKREFIQLMLGENLEGIICTRLVPRVGGGRLLALEIMRGSIAVKTLIKEGKIHQINNVFQIGSEAASISLDRFLADLVKSGEVLVNEAEKYAIDINDFQSMIRR